MVRKGARIAVSLAAFIAMGLVLFGVHPEIHAGESDRTAVPTEQPDTAKTPQQPHGSTGSRRFALATIRHDSAKIHASKGVPREKLTKVIPTAYGGPLVGGGVGVTFGGPSFLGLSIGGAPPPPPVVIVPGVPPPPMIVSGQPRPPFDPYADAINRLKSRHNHSRRDGALTLGQIGDPRAVPLLIDLLQHDWDTEVRVAAAQALGAIGDRRAAGPLEHAALSDYKHDVRQAAGQAYALLPRTEPALSTPAATRPAPTTIQKPRPATSLRSSPQPQPGTAWQRTPRRIDDAPRMIEPPPEALPPPPPEALPPPPPRPAEPFEQPEPTPPPSERPELTPPAAGPAGLK